MTDLSPVVRNRATAQRERRQDGDCLRDLFLALHLRHRHRERIVKAPKAEMERIVAELDALDRALDEAYAALLGRLGI